MSKFRTIYLIPMLLLYFFPGERRSDRITHPTMLRPATVLTDRQKAEVQYLRSQLDGLIAEASARQYVPATSLFIYANGEVLYSKSIGASYQTPFWIASTTKPITSLAIHRLAHLGKLNLDMPAIDYLPGHRIDKKPGDRFITIRSLLNQTSGIPYEGRSPNINIGPREKPLWIPTPLYPADCHYEYSNANYYILARVIEEITGKSYDQAMKQLVFEPLHMDHSTTSGHVPGASNITSSGEDLTRFAAAVLDSVNNTNNDFLDPDTARELMQIPEYLPVASPRETLFYYGPGWWFFRQGSGTLAMYHTGIWNGVYSEVAIFPEHDGYMVTLSNPGMMRSDAVNSFRSRIASLGRALVSAATASPVRLESLQPSPPGRDRLAQYAGRYTDASGRTVVDIRAQGDRLLQKKYAAYTSLTPHTINEFFGSDRWNKDQFVFADGQLIGYSDIAGFYSRK